MARWTRILQHRPAMGAGLSLAMGEFPFPKSPRNGTRPPPPPRPCGTSPEDARAPRARKGTSPCWPEAFPEWEFCMWVGQSWGTDFGAGRWRQPTCPGSVLPSCSLAHSSAARCRAAAGSQSAAHREQPTLSPKALGCWEETGRTCSGPGNPCFLLQPGRSGQPQCTLPPRRCQALV